MVNNLNSKEPLNSELNCIISYYSSHSVSAKLAVFR